MKALLLMLLAGSLAAQEFGGSAPWGPEKPTAFKGEVKQGESFEAPAGGGIWVGLVPINGADWTIEVGGAVDYSRCVNVPLHGPTARDILAGDFPSGIGVKRWIYFTLTAEEHQQECDFLNVRDLEHWGTHVSGKCSFTLTKVKLGDGPKEQQLIESIAFEGECAPHGAWELWKLPATYVIPDNFTGWVTVYYGEKNAPALPRSGDRYVAAIGRTAVLHTSSDLRHDMRGARLQSQESSHIFGWVGVVNNCGEAQTFFAGTQAQFEKAPDNPAMTSPKCN